MKHRSLFQLGQVRDMVKSSLHVYEEECTSDFISTHASIHFRNNFSNFFRALEIIFRYQFDTDGQI